MKKYIAAIFVAALSAAALFGVESKKEWAKFSKYEEANKGVEAPSAVFMGDSITEGWARIHPDFFKSNNYAGRGISGQTTSEMLVRFRADVIALKPKAVAIMAGTNDIAENNGPIKLEYVFGNIASMAELAKANGIRVFLCSVIPAADFPWRKGLEPSKKIKALNAMLKEYALKNGIVYVDYYSALDDGNGGLPKNLAKDGVHPTAEGYDIMEPIIKAAIEKK